MNEEVIGSDCEFCGLWVHDTGDWFCEECGQSTCERCGKFDHVEEVFLCPECFAKEAVRGEKSE